MGWQLVRQVEAKAMGGGLDDLSKTAHLALIYMAQNAHDKGTEDTPQACYFRGWAHLAAVLGYPGLTKAGERTVARAVSELVTAGLIKVDDWEGHRRRQTCYRLTLT